MPVRIEWLFRGLTRLPLLNTAITVFAVLAPFIRLVMTNFHTWKSWRFSVASPISLRNGVHQHQAELPSSPPCSATVQWFHSGQQD